MPEPSRSTSPSPQTGREALAEALAEAGCVAAFEEADELIAAAAGDDRKLLEMAKRRAAGEPLAWVTGEVIFCGYRVLVAAGVYVPRWQSEPLAYRATELLPEDGLAVDMACGSGAIARVLAAERPSAVVLATDIDRHACECALSNGVQVFEGHLGDPLPADVRGRVDVVVGVVPYVPTDQLVFLPRDVQDYEPALALDGGPEGTRLLAEAVRAAAGLLRPGGNLLLEMGGDQDRLLEEVLSGNGFGTLRTLCDEDGDLRGIQATLQAPAGGPAEVRGPTPQRL